MLREGDDVTIVAILRMVDVAEKAAKTLANEHGVEAEVIDPRTLRPLDLDTILDSVRKTNRCVIVEEGWPHGGVGANLAALIAEQAFDHLDAPIQRVTGADVPMPYSKRLEQAAIPHPEHVVSAALATLEGALLVATDVVMPRLSDSMEEGTVLRWLKSPGDEVSVGEELVEIETDKANMVYEAPGAGTLVEIVAQEGDTLPIGEVIARVGEAGRGLPRGARRRPGADGSGRRDAKPHLRRRAAEPAASRRRSACPRGSRGPPREAPPSGGWKGQGVAAGPADRQGERARARGASPARGPGDGSSRPTSSGRSPPARLRSLPAPAAAPPPAPAEPTPGARERPETAKGASRGGADASSSRPSPGGWPSRRPPRRTSTCPSRWT